MDLRTAALKRWESSDSSNKWAMIKGHSKRIPMNQPTNLMEYNHLFEHCSSVFFFGVGYRWIPGYPRLRSTSDCNSETQKDIVLEQALSIHQSSFRTIHNKGYELNKKAHTTFVFHCILMILYSYEFIIIWSYRYNAYFIYQYLWIYIYIIFIYLQIHICIHQLRSIKHNGYQATRVVTNSTIYNF